MTGGGYWRNKLLRLCPLYYTVTLLSAGAHFAVPDLFRDTLVTGKTVLMSLLFLPCYAKNGTIYPVYGVGWTLNLEMFFYVLMFFAIKINKRYRGELVAGMTGVLVISGRIYPFQSAAMKSWTSINMLYFLAGIFLYYLDRHGKLPALSRTICAALMVPTLGLLFGGYYLAGEENLFLWNLGWNSFLVMLCLTGAKEMRCPKALVALGDCSYSLYLTHNVVIRAGAKVFLWSNGISFKNTCFVVLALGLAVICAGCAYILFEKKFVRFINGRSGMTVTAHG